MANSNVNFLQTATVVPHIPALEMAFIGRGLLPDRLVHFFFDGVPIQKYVQGLNKIYLRGNTDYWDFTSDRTSNPLVIGSNTASLVLSSHDEDTGNTILYVANVIGQIAAGRTMTTVGQVSHSIARYVHVSGTSRGSGTANTILLANDSSFMANNYWGTDDSNSIFIVSGTGLRQFGNIAGFNNVTRTITLSNSLSTNTDNTSAYTISLPQGGLMVDDYGFVAGIFHIPEDTTQAFRTGDREFKITDSIRNDDSEAESYAREMFYSSGLQLTASQIGTNYPITVTPPDHPPPPPPPPDDDDDPPPPDDEDPPSHPPPPVPPIINRPGWTNVGLEGGNGGGRDPLGQTFFVPASEYPNGIFLTSINLFFARKDANNLPVFLEIRSTVNGYPSSNFIVPNSTVMKTPRQVKVSDDPLNTDPDTATNFKFPAPVYLSPGEWSFVVLTSSPNYQLYCAELGQTEIGTTNIVSKQPYIGSMFKSQNGSTWTAIQGEDLMFSLKRAKFVPSGTVLFKNRYTPLTSYGRPAAADLFYTHVNESILPNTSISHTHSIDSGSSFEAYTPDTYYNPSSRVTISSQNKYQLSVSLSTSDNAVSPVIGYTQFNTIAIQKLINNGNISNLQIAITDAGGGYAANANVALVFGDGAGNTSPAVGYALADADGVIESVIVTDGGARFTNDMTVTPASGNATFNFISETDSYGGPVQAKYISRIATLADGFDGGDLRLFITANKPAGTEIKCYYKIRNNNDTESFDQKNYIEFAQVTSSARISADDKERIEYEFRPSLTADRVSYTTDDDITFNTFNQYAIKIVLLSDNTTKNPTVYDMRCIALPGTE